MYRKHRRQTKRTAKRNRKKRGHQLYNCHRVFDNVIQLDALLCYFFSAGSFLYLNFLD